MATGDLPTRVVAGVNVPNTPLISKALDFAREHSTAYTYNHIVHSFLFGFVIADKIPHTKDRDREVHAIAAILHDLGFPIGHPPHSEVISNDKRFEVDGANAARDFINREAKSGTFNKHRLQLVWDAIALHTIGTIVFHKQPEVQACAFGIWADFQGPDRIPGNPLSWVEYNAVVKVRYPLEEDRACSRSSSAFNARSIMTVKQEYPRLGLMRGLKDNMLHLCKTKPETTMDNTVGEWGDRYLSEAEYSRKGKLTQDLLETCDLDERTVD